MAEILIRMKKMMEDFNQTVKILEEENKKKQFLKKQSSQNSMKYVHQDSSKNLNNLFNRPQTSKIKNGVNHQFNLIPIIKSTPFLTETITKKAEKIISKRKNSHSITKRPMTGNTFRKNFSLEKSLRKNPFADLPPVSISLLPKGCFFLTYSGRIPKDANLEPFLKNQTFRLKSANLHSKQNIVSRISNTKINNHIENLGVFATKIQTAFRAHLERKKFLFVLKNVRTLQNFLIKLEFKSKLKKKLESRKKQVISSVCDLQKSFSKSWESIKVNKRIEIFISESNENFENELSCLQLFRAVDANIEIIFISKRPISNELKIYYSKIFHLNGIKDFQSRINFVCPDFNFSKLTPLSSLIYYSSKTLRILKKLLNKPAYIITQKSYQTDYLLSEFLKIPLLNYDPSQHLDEKPNDLLFILRDLNFPIKISSYPFRIENKKTLIQKFLELTRNNKEIEIWIFISNNSQALFDWSLFPETKRKIINEKNKIQSFEEEIWNLLKTGIKLLQKGILLSIHADDFLNYFDGHIDGVPPQTRISTLQYVNMSLYVSPNGSLSETFTCNKVKSPFLNDFAFQFPQNSFPDLNTKKISQIVCQEFYKKGIHGFVNIDLTVFEAEGKKNAASSFLSNQRKLFWINSVYLSFSEVFKIMAFWNFISIDWEFDSGQKRFTLGQRRKKSSENKLKVNNNFQANFQTQSNNNNRNKTQNVSNEKECKSNIEDAVQLHNIIHKADSLPISEYKFENFMASIDALDVKEINFSNIKNESSLEKKNEILTNFLQNTKRKLQFKKSKKLRFLFYFPKLKFYNPQKEGFSDFFSFCRKENLFFDLEKGIGTSFIGVNEGKGGLLISQDENEKLGKSIFEVLGRLQREVGKEEDEDEIGVVRRYIRSLRF